MQRQQPNGCLIILGTVILIALAPFILEVLGLILFVLVSFIGHVFGAW